MPMRQTTPIVSFTFDDFPESSLFVGGAILRSFDLKATYYASFGLMGKDGPTGRIFSAGDLSTLVDQGHELGCHTFDHCSAWDTKLEVFEQSILKNRSTLQELLPGTHFKTFSYPVSEPRPATKNLTSQYFDSSRGGGQAYNAGTADLNYLKAYFIDAKRSDEREVKECIDENCRAGGWLIFATHDISDSPTPYGCTPAFFRETVRAAIASGSHILPVTRAREAACSAT